MDSDQAALQLCRQSDAFAVYNVSNPSIPILISVPHAGRDYPAGIIENLRLPADSLVRLEDRYVDLLARGAVAAGVPVIMAKYARAWIDLNRDEQDIDAEMVAGLDRTELPSPSAKQRGGLGLIPRRLSGLGDIWKRSLEREDVEQRIGMVHRPYHAQIDQILSAMRRRFGAALLLDLHSMPPVDDKIIPDPPRFVIGDQYGRSASSRFSELALSHIRMSGFAVNLNYPYAGDYILRRHGRPAANIHAIQLEVDRSLYLDELLREPVDGVARIAKLVTDLTQILADAVLDNDVPIAAE
ncbi:N-formylglutamate amidohydrolase [Sphingorhabdus arenilitoris]|uniref:N-formylglutamate amidohydrolase n=1 Tax=Sphingorhabdus arenilitoris TaxID=1490041 RepID=A0ABV8RHN8_9SPHN